MARIVGGCSDSLTVNENEKAPWKDRKRSHLDHLKSAGPDVLIVTAADKTHNARAIASDLEAYGAVLWDRFNATPSEIIWYYDSSYELLSSAKVSQTLLIPLRAAIKVMKAFE